MKDLMSIKSGEIVTGKHINEWCEKYMHNQNASTIYRKEAKRLFNRYFEEDAQYCATHTPELNFQRIK